MTITDGLLTNMAKALNSESYNVPTHNVVATTEVTSIDTTATTLSGIIGTADAVTNIRSEETVNFTAIRSGTGVVGTAGDSLKSAGIFDASSGGNLLAGVPINELHTTAFDLEFDWDITIGR